MKNEIQLIGMDIGRGYVKAYSEVDDNVKKTIFKSVYGDGRDGKVELEVGIISVDKQTEGTSGLAWVNLYQ